MNGYSLEHLITAVVAGQNDRAVSIAEVLLKNGTSPESLIQDGLTVALRSLDAKCTAEEFNLLEIMLAGRAMMTVMDNVIATHLLSSSAIEPVPEKTIIIGTIKGDIHELGKNVVKMMLKAQGLRVIDIGKDASPESFVKAAMLESARFIGVSSLITLTMPFIREIRPLLNDTGLDNVKILAGGAAIQQASPSDLNVDFVAQDVFDAVHYLNGLTS